MLRILWYAITGIASLAGAAWLMDKLAWFIADGEPPPEFEQAAQWILEKEQWYLNTDFGTKLLIVGIMTFIVLILPLSCKLDEYIRQLPTGQFMEIYFGESPFEEYWIFRLLPGMVFFAYIFLRIVCLFFPNVEFSIQTFSMTGEGYTIFQWITQGTYFLILALTIFLIFDSFLSAGLLGGIIHLAVVLGANLISMVLAFAIIITLMQALPVAIAAVLVVIVISALFYGSYRVIYIYV